MIIFWQKRYWESKKSQLSHLIYSASALPPTAPSWTHWLQNLGYSSVRKNESRVKKTEEIKQWLVEFWQCTIQHLSEECSFRVSPFARYCRSTSYLRCHSKRFLIAYFIGNTSVKNIKIRSRVAKLYSKPKVGVFFRHCILLVLFLFPRLRFFDVPEPILPKICQTTRYVLKLITSYGGVHSCVPPKNVRGDFCQFADLQTQSLHIEPRHSIMRGKLGNLKQ